jgi:Carboxypeptidase regulatory-like domain
MNGRQDKRNGRLENRRRGRIFAAFSCALLVLCWLVPAAMAQETTAGIQGVVKDSTGAVVAGATVELSGSALMGTKKVKTDATGAYRFASLPPGDYTLTVTAEKFRAYKQTGIDLSAGRLPTIDVQLEVGTVGEVIEVTGAAPVVDVTQSKVAVTVEKEVLDNMPTGRSFQSVIPFAAGARQEPLQSTTGNRMGGFQIDGASDSENVYLIDGMNTTNIQDGGVGKNFQTDFLQEVQIKSSSFEAEFGGALGGVINAVPKHGSNDWHGQVLTYFQTNKLNANDACASGMTSNGFSTVCGLRLDANGNPEYYVPKKDARTILEPGFEVGGPIFKDKLWLFTSYIPTIDTTRRTTTFVAPFGARTLNHTFIQHNAYTRLDYQPFNALRLFAGWNYAYSRNSGALGNPDSAFGQTNAGASSNPANIRGDTGTVNPLAFYSFGGDWTPTAKLVVSARYGYFFSNNEDRGRPEGLRYLYNQNLTTASLDAQGNPILNPSTPPVNGAALAEFAGFNNMPSNLQTFFDAYKRNSFNGDASYVVGNFLGSHVFKGGYAWMRQSNDVLRDFKTEWVTIDWLFKAKNGLTSYSPLTSTTACDAVINQNIALGFLNNPKTGKPDCTGLYGFFTVGNGVINTGGDKTYSNALYIQDAWAPSFMHGLTLNLGVRFDQERLPAYDPTRFPSVEFGWGQKIAPRLGGAYDLLHNGKIKVYASYGKFFDIMKMGLSRGSFGSDYWHNCVYALDTIDYSTIVPTLPKGGGCPGSGPAPGVPAASGTGLPPPGQFRFIENVDFRATKIDPRDPAIDPNMKPMEQHEFVAGVDWVISKNYSLESRYSRKRLDRTIEDMAITDNLGFYIGNPGTHFADVLRRQFIDDPAVGLQGPLCPDCPPPVPAIRRYDGVEFRLSRSPRAGNWFGSVSYTYSRLTGNYAGLTNTDPTDGGGGRHSPNNGRAFDIPTMTYLPNGQIDDGPLSTDRPNTLKLYGYYRLKWLGQGTTLGFFQSILQGTPIGTCLGVVGTQSACQWAEGRGNLVKFHTDALGNFVKDGVVNDARTPAYLQTDFNLKQEFHVSKEHENRLLSFEADIFNLLNQHAAVAFNENPLNGAGKVISNKVAANPTIPADPGIGWKQLMTGYDYVAEINKEGLPMNPRYALPQVFQGARTFRLAARFTF